jgi:hypothetical protein
MGLALGLGLTFTPLGCGSGQEFTVEPSHHAHEGPSVPRATVAQLTDCTEIVTTLQESSWLVDKTLGELKGACPEEPFHACAMLLGYVMSDMFDTVMAPIYDEHPDLAPDWYRESPPREGKRSHT